MFRLLLIAAIIAAAWYLYRRIAVGKNIGTDNPSAPPAAPGQDIIRRCDQCGIHVPEVTGVRYQALFFCCPEHLNEHLRKP